jgi:hypothetical protein
VKSFSAWKRIAKRAKKPSEGRTVVTLAFYGPDDRRASKVAVGVAPPHSDEITDIRRWVSESSDVRRDEQVASEILDFISTLGPVRIAMTDRIIGCPHEEGVDYEGEICPLCAFWADRDRWTGKLLRPSQRS